jgi:hypothetical protein
MIDESNEIFARETRHAAIPGVCFPVMLLKLFLNPALINDRQLR